MDGDNLVTDDGQMAELLNNFFCYVFTREILDDMPEPEQMEEEIKALQKHMAGLVRTILDLKSRVESLEGSKAQTNPKDDFDKLLKKQKTVDDAINANTAAIVKIDEEIKVLNSSTKQKAAIEAKSDAHKGRKVRKCRYYNRGHCKQKSSCEFIHPKDVCKVYLD